MGEFNLQQTSDLIAAIGGLGVASFALVDISKIGRQGGISHSGFSFIEGLLRLFEPPLGVDKADKSKSPPWDLFGQVRQILHANWINGMVLGDQKAIAKSLIKLRLFPDTARHFAAVTHVDAESLARVAQKMTTGAPLDGESETNTLGRFDLALTALVDAAYQLADQQYRNRAKAWASGIAVLMAIFGGWIVSGKPSTYWQDLLFFKALCCGILAVPLAPIAKDLTSALAAGVKVAQALRK